MKNLSFVLVLVIVSFISCDNRNDALSDLDTLDNNQLRSAKRVSLVQNSSEFKDYVYSLKQLKSKVYGKLNSLSKKELEIMIQIAKDTLRNEELLLKIGLKNSDFDDLKIKAARFEEQDAYNVLNENEKKQCFKSINWNTPTMKNNRLKSGFEIGSSYGECLQSALDSYNDDIETIYTIFAVNVTFNLFIGTVNPSLGAYFLIVDYLSAYAAEKSALNAYYQNIEECFLFHKFNSTPLILPKN